VSRTVKVILIGAALLLILLAVSVFWFALRPKQSTWIKQMVCADDETLVGTMSAIDGSWFVWTYEMRSDSLSTLAKTDNQPWLQPGSSPKRVLFVDDKGYSALEYGRTSMLPTDFGFWQVPEKSHPFITLLQGTELALFGKGGPWGSLEAPLQEFVLWDMVKGKEVGTLQRAKEVEKRIPFLGAVSPPLGLDKDLFLIADPFSRASKMYSIRLYSTHPFSELANIAIATGAYVREIVPVPGEERAVLVLGGRLGNRPHYLTLAFRAEPTGEWTLEVQDEWTIPEPVKEIRVLEWEGPLDMPSRVGVRNIFDGTWRNNLAFWCTLKPICVNVARTNEEGPIVKIPVQWTDDEYSSVDSLTVNQDGTLVAVMTGPDSFEIWEVDFPDVSLLRKCRLTYSPETGVVSMESDE
jgi:hypothetical protein